MKQLVSCSGLFLLFLVLTAISRPVLGYNVLILHPLMSHSHVMVLRQLAERLLEEGHSVTQLSFSTVGARYTSDSDRGVNVIERRINTSLVSHLSLFTDSGQFRPPVDLLWKHGLQAHRFPLEGVNAVYAQCTDLLADRQLFADLSSGQFSVAVVDLMANECGLALAAALQLPVVGFIAIPGLEVHYANVRVMPSVFATMQSSLAPNMAFSERASNTAVYLLHKGLFWIFQKIADNHIKKYYSHLPPVSVLKRQISVFLLNSNLFLSQPSHLPPNVHLVGCLRCEASSPLDEEMERFMESGSDHGVVVFSLGITGYDAWTVPEHFLTMFLTAFGRLKQKVLMRFSQDRLKTMDVPDNVLVKGWIQQRDILRHRNTRVFVSHCGMNGILEAMYMGVPILGVPIFGDQGGNAKYLEHSGLAIYLDKSIMTENDIYNSLQQLIYNHSYIRRARRLAEIWRQRPETDIERALYWVNTTAFHGPLHQLHVQDEGLWWPQYWLLDVVVVALLSMWLIVTIIQRLFAIIGGLKNCSSKHKMKTN